jgi:Tfp pilus assembly protein PilF
MAYQETPAARLRVLRQRWEADRTSRVFLQLAEEYRRQGMPREALPVLEEGLRHHGSSIAGQVALGRCRLELGQAEGAAAILEKVVERDPTQMVAYRTLVDAYIKLGAPAEARDRLSHYSQLNPQDPEIEALDGQIAVLERAVASGTLPAPPPREAAEPARPGPSTETEATGEEVPADAGEEPVAAPWAPLQPSAGPIARGWSTGSVDAGWISQPAPAPPAAPVPPPAPPPPPSWATGPTSSDAPTAMFSLADVVPPARAYERPVVPQTPAFDEIELPPTSTGETLERDTVRLDLSELPVPTAPSADRAAEWPSQSAADADIASLWLDEAAASAPPPPAAFPEQVEEASSEIEDAYLEPAPAAEWSESLGDGAEVVAAQTDVPERRSWSIGESEIVFSLPARPLLRDLIDLAAVPWRPIALPVWSQPRGSAALGPSAPSAAAPVSTSTPTLAQLYLDQGHADEAAEMFEQVLEREPENPAARAGLERVMRDRARPTARSLMGGFEPEGGLSAKQAYVLRRWASLIREAHSRNAS